MRKRSVYVVSLLALCLAVLVGCNISVNRSIHIRDGEKVNHSQRTVNGGIYVGSHCQVKGSCTTVNGRIKVGSDSEVGGLKTVNSGIRVGENSIVAGSVATVNGSVILKPGVEVDGSATTVNGSVTCGSGVRVAGDVTTVNGSINLEKTVVRQDVRTNNGNITLSDESVVHGDIVIRRSRSFTRRLRHLKIRITGGSLVKGDVIVKDDDLKVTVFLSDGGKVAGKIRNAEVVEK